MTRCSVYPIENDNRGMGVNSNFAHQMLPTYRGRTAFNWQRINWSLAKSEELLTKA